MSTPVLIQKKLTAASSANIAATQTAASGAFLTLNGGAATGGVATLDTQRRVLITSVSNDAGLTFTINGTNQAGASISEKLTGASGAAASSNLDYLTVASIFVGGGATASNVSAGTGTSGATPWQLFNKHITPPYLSMGYEITDGVAVTATIEYTLDPFLPKPAIYGGGAIPVPVNVTSLLSGVSTTSSSSISIPIEGWRLRVTSGIGTAQATGIQAGIRN